MRIQFRMATIRVAALVAGGLLSFALLAQQPSSPQEGPRDRTLSAKIHTELGSMYFQDGNVAVALEELKIAIEADPDYALAYSVRALVNHYLRDVEAAEDDFRRALRLSPDNPDINNNYGWFLCQVGKPKEATAFLLKAIRNPLYTTPDRAYLNAGLCALSAGDQKGAEDFLQKADRLSAQPNPLVRYRLAEIYFQQGRFKEARTTISDVIRSDPSAELLVLAVRIERQLGDRTAEMQHTNLLRRRFPASKEYQELVRGGQE